MTEDLAERLLGGRPTVPSEELARVDAFVREHGLLAGGERCLAAVDDTWLASAKRGRVLTDARLFAYRERDVRDLVRLEAVREVLVRRIWYPGAGPLGRGRVFGEGPVTILRFRFVGLDGRVVRVRLQSFASNLLPFLDALGERFGDRVRVARTLPGL